MKKIILLLMLTVSLIGTKAQNSDLTRERIMQMSLEEISNLPLEDVMHAVEVLNLSSPDELFELIMNKNVQSASKREESTFNSPLSTTVITREEIRTYGVQSIEEAFRLIPGLIVTEKANGNFDIQIRGLNNIPDNNWHLYTENANTLLMVDGRIMHDYAMGALFLDQLPISIEDIAQIEVIRGAASALYGANAVAGVINIITEKPNTESSIISGSTAVSTQNGYQAEFAMRKSFGKIALGATANFQYCERNTDKMFVLPSELQFLANDPQKVPANNTLLTMGDIKRLEGQGVLTDVSKGAYLTPEEINNLRQMFTCGSKNSNGDVEFSIHNSIQPETPAQEMFPRPNVSRDIKAFNGYLSYAPNDKIAVDLSAGYQNSYVLSTPTGEGSIGFNGRTSKTVYANLEASVYGIRLRGDFLQGPQHYTDGTPVFKEKVRKFGLAAEYDLQIGGFNLRPGISYNDMHYEDYDFYRDLGNGLEKMSGYLNSDATLKNFSASLRLDYSIGKARFIGAIRADKSNVPDKWTPAYQLVASYDINDYNFIRASYSRGHRSAVLNNTNASMLLKRTEMPMPNEVQVLGNPEADLVEIDNFELGYRSRPHNRILLDVELFYSQSKNYGQFTCAVSEMGMTKEDMAKLLAQGPNMQEYLQNKTLNAYSYKKIYNQYQVTPFEVKQLGASIGIDWIITSNLIAKLNVNLQKTTIDNHFYYNYKENSAPHLMQCAQSFGQAVGSLYGATMGQTMASQVPQLTQKYIQQGMAPDAAAARAQGEAAQMGAQLAAKKIEDTFYNSEKGMYMTAKSDTTTTLTTEDGYKHKATPAVYGMFGLVYKPLDKLTISAYGNLIGERTTTLKFGNVTLPTRFTLNVKAGYKPTEKVEVFLNARNLLNTKEQEFVYCDEIGGIYTIGLNFAL